MTTLLDHFDQLQVLAGHVLGEVPDPGTGEAPPGADKLIKLLRWVAYLATAACVAGILYSASRMAIAHRRGDDTNVAQLGWVLGACILIGSASGIVAALV
ncbi:hypothetical protein ACNTMW_30965 [Planosporangium sp. 12N6]|uniref:hypothetical protein n=1 Tax=Planosporangium spinosum TaxID=3402278 RepID=UPI003CEB88D7